MEIRIGDRVYQVADDCPVEAPTKGRLLRHSREHGAESFLTSQKMSPYAGCIADRLLEAGAELVEPVMPAEPVIDEQCTSAPEPRDESENHSAEQVDQQTGEAADVGPACPLTSPRSHAD